MYLIDNYELRDHLGPLIGRIASSHHWDVDSLSKRLGDQFNAPSWLPGEWLVDPVKIACILRCADAAHLNNARAPDFLFALIRRNGVSKEHWLAQNILSGPSPYLGDESGETIAYTSSQSYLINQISAWWVAYDAISVVDKEIRLSNELLAARKRINSPVFNAKRVAGANSVVRMADFIKPKGWFPHNAQIHVSNIESLVRNLGGEKLYGEGIDKIEVVFREVLQNARDAIAARREVDQEFLGKIEVSFHKINNENWIFIEDDGVGMTLDVLTGPLLDFGTSFWKTALAQTEFPGLRASKFRPIGRFGIGFYSLFMIASEVLVASKKWDKGLHDVNQVLFNEGLTLRPAILQGRPDNFNSRISTQIRIKIEGVDEVFLDNDDVLVKSRLIKSDVAIANYISGIVIGLDVDVFYSGCDKEKKLIHAAVTSSSGDGRAMLHQIFSCKEKGNEEFHKSYIENNFHRLRMIQDNGRILGFAALSTVQDNNMLNLSSQTVGGLSTMVGIRGYMPYIGYMEYQPRSARRDALEIDISKELMNIWYEEQIQILENEKISDADRCIIAAYACQLDMDPMNIGKILIADGSVHQFISYDEVINIVLKKKVTFFKSTQIDCIERHHRVITHDQNVLVLPMCSGNYISINIENGVPKNPFSLIGCIDRVIRKSGKTPLWSVEDSKYHSHFGVMEELVLTVKERPEVGNGSNEISSRPNYHWQDMIKKWK